MKHYEIFDGRAYLLTVMPSENPWDVLDDERKIRRNPRLRMVSLQDGVRTLAEGPSMPVLEEDEFFGEAEEE
ncbi:MAG: hypothetical protein MN733_34680 [Nitrososphaera sp.]|nr:hypothetical protein [Nitrososphaera sp.]